MAIYHPPTFINAFLQAHITQFWKTGEIILPDNPSTLNINEELLVTDPILPFFPTSPTNLDDLTEGYPQSEGTFAVYDRMLKLRKSPNAAIKSEQLMYYFYKMAGDPVRLIEIVQNIQDLLDWEDDSARYLNAWSAAKQKSANPLRDEKGNKFPLVYFHRFRIYQLQETRDIVNFGTARTYAGNKIIIDYDWHKS